jgi:hypothetical protein
MMHVVVVVRVLFITRSTQVMTKGKIVYDHISGDFTEASRHFCFLGSGKSVLASTTAAVGAILRAVEKLQRVPAQIRALVEDPAVVILAAVLAIGIGSISPSTEFCFV